MQRLKSGLEAAVAKTQDVAAKAKDAEGRKQLLHDTKETAKNTVTSAKATASTTTERLRTEQGRKQLHAETGERLGALRSRAQRQVQWSLAVAEKKAEAAVASLQAAACEGPSDSGGSTWSCVRCTLINEDSTTKCLACEAPRPACTPTAPRAHLSGGSVDSTQTTRSQAPLPELILKCGTCSTLMRYPSWATRVYCPNCGSTTSLSTMRPEQHAALERAQETQLSVSSAMRQFDDDMSRLSSQIQRDLERAWSEFFDLGSDQRQSAEGSSRCMFAEITVPSGVTPGQSVQVLVNGISYVATIPPGVRAGERIRVQVQR
eukprot:TRINITY_DN3299_c0_g3_i1.p1 TRINITY_DN3299_c0_g3~~TRINITY_DN3299_c0_g3_i1.p1  ORF type:complete len:319 (-),score=33.87 TRINITY_DN3299_c0_g3_i1:21-977(-)